MHKTLNFDENHLSAQLAFTGKLLQLLSGFDHQEMTLFGCRNEKGKSVKPIPQPWGAIVVFREKNETNVWSSHKC